MGHSTSSTRQPIIPACFTLEHYTMNVRPQSWARTLSTKVNSEDGYVLHRESGDPAFSILLFWPALGKRFPQINWEWLWDFAQRQGFDLVTSAMSPSFHSARQNQKIIVVNRRFPSTRRAVIFPLQAWQVFLEQNNLLPDT